MVTEIGEVEAIFRYPVKSMGGNDRSAFPWLIAGKLPELLLFTPQDPPPHVRTPKGELMHGFGEELAREVGRRYGCGGFARIS